MVLWSICRILTIRGLPKGNTTVKNLNYILELSEETRNTLKIVWKKITWGKKKVKPGRYHKRKNPKKLSRKYFDERDTAESTHKSPLEVVWTCNEASSTGGGMEEIGIRVKIDYCDIWAPEDSCVLSILVDRKWIEYIGGHIRTTSLKATYVNRSSFEVQGEVIV